MERFFDRCGKLIRRGYALLFAFVFLAYIGFAALPPVLMNAGQTRTARTLYQGFRFLCHQYPQRSYFLFGEQRYYPVKTDENSGQLSFEEAAGISLSEVNARTFYGNPRMGYKMAVCQRDVAIYAAMALYCLIFFLSQNRLNGISLPVWALLAVLPVALDGGTQLAGHIFPTLFGVRESTPLLRTATGALFGFFTCAFLIPRLEKSLRDGENK